MTRDAFPSDGGSSTGDCRPNGRQKIQIAERAAVALRSVDRYFDGKTTANTSVHVERALRELGLERFVRRSAA